ncbi:Endonuclease YncB, thermonuclease family (plasmid) [Halalkaliarchaeum sp. AArc-CO]|uniref:hypothetical protein n=1 Tax=Halalkaliarchaeum sp. AArc-CO TaxID=2866381 RepID=UPI00217E1064|nr:hypothetical protein [Halalkaliarchaeum sp. AArc-CO]UWG49271.1 Endonuclease YncB, thermonuclease family [Halalkaliarchaeum sp. AArc-CO]
MEANRKVTVTPREDANAYLRIEEGGENGWAASDTGGPTGDGVLDIDLDGGHGSTGGSGPNIRATTTLNDVFRVGNEHGGGDDVWVYVEFDTADGSVDEDDFDFYDSDGEPNDDSIVGEDNAVELGSGEEVEVGIWLDFDDDVDFTQVLNNIDIFAENEDPS